MIKSSGEEMYLARAKQRAPTISLGEVAGKLRTHAGCSENAEHIRSQQTTPSTITTAHETRDESTDRSTDGEDRHRGAPEKCQCILGEMISSAVIVRLSDPRFDRFLGIVETASVPTEGDNS